MKNSGKEQKPCNNLNLQIISNSVGVILRNATMIPFCIFKYENILATDTRRLSQTNKARAAH